MPKSILFIDGENFLHKVEEVLKEEGIDKYSVNLGGSKSRGKNSF